MRNADVPAGLTLDDASFLEVDDAPCNGYRIGPNHLQAPNLAAHSW